METNSYSSPLPVNRSIPDRPRLHVPTHSGKIEFLMGDVTVIAAPEGIRYRLPDPIPARMLEDDECDDYYQL